DRDAVGARLVLDVLHVRPAGRVAVVVLVLDLVGDHRGAAVGDLVAGQDAVDLGLPLVGPLRVLRVARAGVARGGGQPAGEAAAADLGVGVWAGGGDDVQARLLRRVELLVDVAHAGEVVDAGRGGVVAPVEVQRRGVEAGRLHLLEDVQPQVGARQ